MKENEPKSFLRQWGLLAGFGVVVLGAAVGFRFWVDQKAEAPVADAYRSYLEFAATHSPFAKQYLSQYYAKFSRSTVASRHFKYVCGVVTNRAESDGVNLDTFSSEMASGCRTLAKSAVRGDAP